MSHREMSVGFLRQWRTALLLSRGRATTDQLAAQGGVTRKTVRRDLVVLSRVFALYRDRIGQRVYWTMAEEAGAQRVRVLLRRQRRSLGTYPAIEEVA